MSVTVTYKVDGVEYRKSDTLGTPTVLTSREYGMKRGDVRVVAGKIIYVVYIYRHDPHPLSIFKAKDDVYWELYTEGEDRDLHVKNFYRRLESA